MVLVDILVPNEVMVSAILFIEVRLPMSVSYTHLKLPTIA